MNSLTKIIAAIAILTTLVACNQKAPKSSSSEQKVVQSQTYTLFFISSDAHKVHVIDNINKNLEIFFRIRLGS
jgi:hypothetical protein